MTVTLFFSILFALITLIIIATMIIKKQLDFIAGAMLCAVSSFACYMDQSEKYDATNVLTCNKLGTVQDTNCALFKTSGKFPVTYAECRVEMDNGSRHNMRLLVLKGDQVEHCTNSLDKFKYADYHKISE